jgi:hypothetical protein
MSKIHILITLQIHTLWPPSWHGPATVTLDARPLGRPCLPHIYILRGERSRTNRLERQDEMRVHEQDARWFKFLNLV